MMRVLALVALVGCGRIDFGPHGLGGGGGGGGADAAPSDASNVGLVAYWPMDEIMVGSSTNFTFDVIGGHTAQCTSGQCPTINPGVVGHAATFDGNTTCMSVASMQGWADPTFTIAAWVQSSTLSGPILVHESVNGCPSPEISLNKGAGLTQLNTTGTTPHNEAWTPDALIDGNWHHVAVAWDGTSQQVYVDGQCSCSITPSLGPLDNVQPLTVGCYPTGGATHFSGSIDELRVYNRVLSLDEIGSLYAVGGRAFPAQQPCTRACATAPPP